MEHALRDRNRSPLCSSVSCISETLRFQISILQITVNEDRTINLLEAFKSGTTEPDNNQKIVNKTASEADKQPQSQPHTVRIDKIVLQKGEVAILDRSVKPRFSSTLSDQRSGFRAFIGENMLGEVELKAKYDESAPHKITGKINPLGKDLYADLKVDFKDMDLTSVSPYSGRYAGYTIQKGQLSFQLQYLINQNKLDAKNSIFIDQFTFGDSVESPDATSLPVRLAVALLKDRNGEIHRHTCIRRTKRPQVQRGWHHSPSHREPP